MEKIAQNILETIGNTPLVRIQKLNTGKAEVIAKVEYFNPGGSVKDRIGLAMIEAAEKSGTLQPGGLIIEPTSGNTGIGLAVAAAVKGYRMILTMPETMSIERRKLLAAYGAKIVLTPGAEGMAGSIAKAKELQAQNPGSFIPQQFENPANPAYHVTHTAEEIWRDTCGKVDAFVAGVGTGGTLSGVGKGLKAHNPELQLIAVEPSDSPIISGGKAGPHKLQGIGANFIPKTLDTKIIDRVMPISAEDAGRTAREAAAKEGLLIGISSGAALFAALELSKEPQYGGKRIVVLLPDNGERYLSTWLFSE
ncbi:MAG: cysteine synthase A [Lentisphaeria bacterium]|nr:cysteine synthase A [Lentisphaeria bacterium]